MGVLYDIIRISRRVVKVGTPVVLSEDILFFILCAPLVFAVAYITNDGEVRIYGFFGAAMGIVTYFALVKNRFVNIGTAVLLWLIKACLAVLRWVLFPVKLVLRALKKPVDVVMWYTGKSFAGLRRRGRTLGTRVKLRSKALFAMMGKK